MSNIKISVEGVEKEFRNIGLIETKTGDFQFEGNWYREVEQDYEILSFKNECGTLWTNEIGLFTSDKNTTSHSLPTMLEYLKDDRLTIESVKRLSDGEVFTVGEDEKKIGKISRIELVIDEIFLHSAGCLVRLANAAKVKQPTILLKTEDGVEITDRKTELFACDSIFDILTVLPSSKIYQSCKYFSTEAARDEYILQNKPITVTCAEIIKNYQDCADNDSTIEDDVKAFFKSKQNNTI